MKWKLPTIGEIRIVWKRAWLPRDVAGYKIWLEWYIREEEFNKYNGNYYWSTLRIRLPTEEELHKYKFNKKIKKALE